MKFWKWLPAIYTAHASAFAALGYLVGPSWYGMACAAAVGYFLGTALWVTHCNRWRALFKSAQDALQEMTDINEALIHNRVMLHFQGEVPPPDLVDEHKPRLH